jgi:peptide/nickel transport system permease protein
MYFSPGNPAELMLRYKSPTTGLNQKTVEMYAEKLGVNNAFSTQFGNWLKDAVRGDFGRSFKTGLPVAEEFLNRVGCTLSIMIFATILSLFIGVVLGIVSAMYNNGFIDHIVRFLSVVTMSMPNFWIALLFLWVFAIKLKWFPSFGFRSFSSIVLPGTVLALGNSASITRMVKSCVIENIGLAYVTTARAKGLSEGAVFVRHILKNVTLPVITLSGMNMAGLLGGSAIIESIFGLPGIGSYLVTAISLKDFPVIMGFTFIMGILVVLINFLVDLTFVIVDPRVRQAFNER